MDRTSFKKTSSSIGLFLLLVCLVAFSTTDHAAAKPETGIDMGLNETDSLSGSYVAFDPAVAGESCFTQGVAQDFCFRAESFTNDWEYVYYIWLQFPEGWVVNNVTIFGTPACDSGGSFGELTFAVSPQNVVQINHSRYMASSDHCTVYYLVNVTPGATPIDAPVSWYWDGDGYASAPHHPCSNDGYTPAGQEACDEMINPPAMIPPCVVLPGVYLLPETQSASGCAGEPQIHELSLRNLTGSDGVFDMDYSISSGIGTLTGPATVTVPNDAIQVFEVTLTPDASLLPGELVVGLISAEGNGYSDTATINKTTIAGGWEEIAVEPNNGRMDNAVVTYDGKIWSITGYSADADVRYFSPDTDGWTTVTGSAAPFGINYVRSGAVWGDKAYVYGDSTTAGFTGLWSYNMATNVWTNEAPAGTAPAQTGIWAPSWVVDPYTGLLYITGGATVPGGGDLTTVYVYDPTANAWQTPLPNFTTARDFHAAFIYVDPVTGHRMLAVVAGVDAASTYLTSTQCYDFTSGVWNVENADIPAVSVGHFGMGYTQRFSGRSGEELWMIGGADAVGLVTNSTYFDVDSGTWMDGGVYSTTPVYRNAAAALNDKIYKISGSEGSFTYTGKCSTLEECVPVATPTPDCIRDGDVDLNGTLTAGDAQMAFLIVLGLYSPTYEQECAADCNGDTMITAGDAQLIFMSVLGTGNCVDPL